MLESPYQGLIPFKGPLCIIHKCMWVGESFQDKSVLERIWREGVSSFPMFFLSVVGDKPLCKHRLQKEVFEYHIVFQK
jgi:hypothetical protein